MLHNERAYHHQLSPDDLCVVLLQTSHQAEEEMSRHSRRGPLSLCTAPRTPRGADSASTPEELN